jgi:glycosyltransferase involved in cell wall biosynthesis
MLVPKDDPTRLAAAVSDLISNSSMAMDLADQARRSLEQYRWTKLRSEWRNVYESCLA